MCHLFRYSTVKERMRHAFVYNRNRAARPEGARVYLTGWRLIVIASRLYCSECSESSGP